MDEALLIGRARRGDREAFGALVERHRDSVYRVVRGVLADAAECEDVTQDVFVRAWESLARFRGESGLFTWLYRIAVNAALRARERRRPAPVAEVPETEAPRPREADEDGPSLATLQRLLSELPDEYRVIVVLRDLEGLSYQDIASTLEIPMGTVESRLFRARGQLREMWRARKTIAAGGWRNVE
jgi:RNA polymerase sigma-70 factor, ECF subfamily